MGWGELVRSPQLGKFLNHIVEAKLRGDDASIKAYSIAVDVFGRPTSFDPQVDPIVRVQARRLRGLLQEFERQGLRRSGARITLPVGRYVPEFELIASGEAVASVADGEVYQLEEERAPEPTDRPRAPGLRHLWPQAVAAVSLVVAIGLLLAALQLWREPPPVATSTDIPLPPKVYLSQVGIATGDSAQRALASQLGDRLSAALAQSEGIEVGFVEADKPIQEREGAFLLASTVTQSPEAMEVSFLLTDANSGAQVWGSRIARPQTAASDAEAAEAMVNGVMRELGSFRSPLHARGRAWLEENAMKMDAVNQYVCVLAFRAARDSLSSTASARSIECADHLLRLEPDQAVPIALKGWLTAQMALLSPQPDGSTEEALADAVALAEYATELAPSSGVVHELLANMQGLQGNLQAAKRSYSIAMSFQPYNADARAGYALVLARLGEWTSAQENALAAIDAVAVPSPWYFGVPALQAMREQRYADCVKLARLVVPAGPFGSVIALSAAGLSRDAATIEEFRPEVLNAEALRRTGIMTWVEGRVADPLLLVQMAAGLRAAGVPESALTRAF